MISRVAESCFWLMRYIERSDSTARVLRIHEGMVLDAALPASRRWRPLLVVFGAEPGFVERFAPQAENDGDVVQEYLTWDEDNPTSIVGSLRMAREGARTVREVLSLEMWNALNSLWIWLQDGEGRRVFDEERPAFYEEISQRSYLFHGACHNTMLHEEPFDFMRLGLNVERVSQTARILDLQYHALDPRGAAPEGAVDTVEWIAILRSCAAYEPFFKKQARPLSGLAVAEFLLLECAFPGSVLHALDRAANFLSRIRDQGRAEIGRKSDRLLAELRRDVESLDIEELVQTGLHEVLTLIVDRTAELSAAIGEEYFAGRQTVAPNPMPRTAEA